MITVGKLYYRMIHALEIEGLSIPASYVKLFRREDPIPDTVAGFFVEEETIMCCQAVRHASHGHPVLLTPKNIGCVAAAISLGFVDMNQDAPLEPGIRLYTDLMRQQAEIDGDFKPPTPKDFTDGLVYACRSEGRPEYGLFGLQDSGRFKDRETARRAVTQMMAIQPAVMKAAFFYSNEFNETDLVPDVVVLAVRPVELTRILQGYQYLTGKAVQAVLNPLRAVDSDLIARPYLTGEINVSTYCLGARLVARFEGDRMGIGMPFKRFEEMVLGLEESKTGYPFHRYPGAKQ